MAKETMFALSRQTIEKLDTQILFRWQNKITKKGMGSILKTRNSVLFSVSGYGNDNRELCQIPEVRAFFSKALAEEFPFLYWIHPESEGYVMLLWCCAPVENAQRVAQGLTMHAPSAKHIDGWIGILLDGLNAFCTNNHLGELTNKKARIHFQHFIDTRIVNCKNDDFFEDTDYALAARIICEGGHVEGSGSFEINRIRNLMRLFGKI